MVHTDYLAITWSTSRGRDTYGYNICRLDVRSTSQRYKCMGGGYDMLGTVVGQWLQGVYHRRLLDFMLSIPHADEPYGIRLHYSTERRPAHITLDGSCGIESMVHIAEAIGISLSRTYDRKGRTVGYTITDYGSAEAMKAAGLS